MQNDESFLRCSTANNSSSDMDVLDGGHAVRSDRYYNLTIPLSQVVFVSDERGLQTCWKTIAKVSRSS